MWGDFQAYEGTYNFKYGGLIDKSLIVKVEDKFHGKIQ
jgi:hypothetical protein